MNHDTMPISTPPPVYISRYTSPLPTKYGARIDWQIGERVSVNARTGRHGAGTIKSGLLWHPTVPVCDSPCGMGRWIYEVEIDGELFTVSPELIEFPRGPTYSDGAKNTESKWQRRALAAEDELMRYW